MDSPLHHRVPKELYGHQLVSSRNNIWELNIRYEPFLTRSLYPLSFSLLKFNTVFCSPGYGRWLDEPGDGHGPRNEEGGGGPWCRPSGGTVPGVHGKYIQTMINFNEEKNWTFNGFMLLQSLTPVNISLKLIGKLFNTSMTPSELAIPNTVSSGYFCQIRFCFLVISKT